MWQTADSRLIISKMHCHIFLPTPLRIYSDTLICDRILGPHCAQNSSCYNFARSNYYFFCSNYYLGLAQILEDKLHLTAGKVPVINSVARSKQCGHEAVGVVDVAVEAAQRIGGGADGEVHRGELALGVRLNNRGPTPNPSLYGGELAGIVGVHRDYRFR